MGGNADGAADVAVDDAEEVCRLCFSADVPIVEDKYPNQVDPVTGFIRLEEISHRQVKRGFSVQRMCLFSRAEAEAVAAIREERKRAKGIVANYLLAGVLVARVEMIHQIGGQACARPFNVLKAPVEGEPGHAEIRFNGDVSKEVFLEFRLELQRALGQLREPAILDQVA